MKKINVEIPKYDTQKGTQYSWENNFEIKTELSDNAVVIKANKAGLKSLAYQLLTLAEAPDDKQVHLHYDDINSLEEGSIELIIERI